MNSLSELERLLETQFGSFIRNARYKDAFDRAMSNLKSMDDTPHSIDLFYLFLHQLIIELFDEIDRLTEQLQSK